MSQEQSEQNRSEDPTPFKLKRARERGAVARGMDLGFFTGLSAFLVYAWMFGDDVRAQIAQAIRGALVTAPGLIASERGVLDLTGALVVSATRPLALMIAAVFLVVLVFEIAQVGGLMFSATPLKFDFSRLNPANGLKRVFSLRMLIETGKTLLKLLVYGALAVVFILSARSDAAPVVSDAAGLAAAMTRSGLRLLAAFALAALAFAILDQLISRRDFLKRMRMSRREVKREHRDREGDPRLKQRRKDLHREFAKASQSVRGVRGADLIVVNPVHLAVALRYEPATMEAPVVVARGSHQFALRLKRLAFLYGVVIIESPPLARALHRLEVGQPIPDALYEPVATLYRDLRSRRASATEGLANA